MKYAECNMQKSSKSPFLFKNDVMLRNKKKYITLWFLENRAVHILDKK